MIDIHQWRVAIGTFSGSINNKQVKRICDCTCADRDEVFCDRNEPLHLPPMWLVSIYFGLNVSCMFFQIWLIILSGDVETNPGPVYRTCPACDTQVHIRRKVCMCGQVLTHKHRTPPKVIIETKEEGAYILRGGTRGTDGEGDKAMREGDQGESSPIGRESDREGEIDNKGDKSEGKGTSDNDLTEREVYDTTLEGDGAKSKNDGVGSNSQSAIKKRLRNQKYYQSHKKSRLTIVSREAKKKQQ